MLQQIISDPTRGEEAKYSIDDVVLSADGTKKILFPMNSTGNIKDVPPNHWTLLVYDTEENTWTHYNSLQHRRQDYLKDAHNLVRDIQSYCLLLNAEYLKQKSQHFNLFNYLTYAEKLC